VFESESGYKECFLKADFITGEKIISKAWYYVKENDRQWASIDT
jgi:hypothetical protein